MWARPCSLFSDACAIASIAAISGCAAATGAVHTRIFGHDIFLFLDAGWRVLNGQRPEIDFNPSMGPVLALAAAAGLKLGHNSVDGVGWMSAIVGAIAGLWAYALTRRRLAALPALLAALVLALIATAPFPIGWTPNTLSHAMLYNRYGYALLGLVVLECFGPGQTGLASGFSSGMASTLLLFLKPSYGLAALALLACSAALRRDSWRRVPGSATGILLCSAVMMAYLRFDFGALWSDLRLMSAARSSGLSMWNIRWALFKGVAEFLPLGALAGLVASATSTASPLIATALLWVGGGLLLATNGQPSGYPLNAVLALVLVERGRAQLAGASSSATRIPKPETILVLLGLICYLPVALENATGLLYALADSRKSPVEAVRFEAAPLRDLILYDVPDGTDADQRSNGRAYVTYVNSGIELIQKVSSPADTVVTLDMVNPFPYALRRRPARGGSPVLSFQHTFNDEHKPAPGFLFGFADIVMVPKHPASSEPDARALFRNYLPGIRKDFCLCAESDAWELYQRPNQLQGCASAGSGLQRLTIQPARKAR